MLKCYKLNKSKITKIIIFTIILFFCISTILNVVIASDLEHILHCQKDNCLHCEIIRICQIQNLNVMVVMFLITLLYALNRNKIINLCIRIYKTITLINCKMQLNM